MRPSALIGTACTAVVMAFALTQCRTQKLSVTSEAVTADSSAVVVKTKQTDTFNSQFSTFNFSFDTLDVTIQRPVSADTASLSAVPTQVLRLRAVRGEICDTRADNSRRLRHYNTLDSVAYKTSRAAGSQQSSATTAVASPPNIPLIILMLGIVAAAFYLLLRWLRSKQ